MRIDQDVLTTNIQKFLKDGWQTVRKAIFFPPTKVIYMLRISMLWVIEQIRLSSMHSS
jgi:hypothetical protein